MQDAAGGRVPRTNIGEHDPPEQRGLLAQLVEQLTLNQLVIGSSPIRPTTFSRIRLRAQPSDQTASWPIASWPVRAPQGPNLQVYSAAPRRPPDFRAARRGPRKWRNW